MIEHDAVRDTASSALKAAPSPNSFLQYTYFVGSLK
jgi:hypothetical protein